MSASENSSISAPVSEFSLLDEFKLAMRRLASTVTIVTAHSCDRNFGMAATAVSSVTVSPPSLLVCVNSMTSIHDVIQSEGRFCVNLLGVEHKPLVAAFGGSKGLEDRFLYGTWKFDKTLPILADATASLVCELAGSMRHGTHTIFVGEVKEIYLNGVPRSLIHEDGQFVRGQRIEQAL